jgi:hypothetical protein
VRQRSGLRRQCSAAKEKLLNDPNLKSVEITVLGSGSALIGKSLKTEILREEVLELALEGFLPFSQRGEAPKEEKRSLFRELGLPYVTDPAVTRHLNAFLERRGTGARRHSFQRRLLHSRDSARARGGRGGPVVRPAAGDPGKQRARSRRGARRGVLLVRAVTGSGVLVRGGLPRTYFIGLGEARDGKFSAVCLVPRGAEEGAAIEDR